MRSKANKKLTVGIFVDSFFPVLDGVAMVVDNYAKRLSEYMNVIVFAPGVKDKEYDDTKYNYKVLRCSSISFPLTDYYLSTPLIDKNFKKEIENSKLDIVHIHSPFTIGKEGIKYAKKHKVAIVGTLHSQYKQDFKRAVKSEFLAKILTSTIAKRFDKCDKLFSVNNEIKKIYKEEYGCTKEITIINNATEMKEIENQEETNEYINNKYNIEKNDKIFLFVGRINKLKNIFFIVDAIKQLKKKAKFKFKMIFVGDGQDLYSLKEYIQKNKLEKYIIFAGKIFDRIELAKYYKRADLFLFPSFYDTNSLVQIEAASQKTPTLFLKGSATSYYIKNNINGFICENDANLYAEKIIEVLENKELYNKVSKNAYKEIYKTWDDVVKELIHEYNKLIIVNKL